MPSTRARTVAVVGLTMKPVGNPDAGNPHVRFDERGWETGRCRMAQASAPILDSTSEIRGRCAQYSCGVVPDYASLHPGYVWIHRARRPRSHHLRPTGGKA